MITGVDNIRVNAGASPRSTIAYRTWKALEDLQLAETLHPKAWRIARPALKGLTGVMTMTPSTP